MRVLCVFVMLWQGLLCMEPSNSIKRKMSVGQNLTAKNNLFYGWNTQFLARKLDNRKKQIFLRLFSGKNKNFAKY